MTTYHARRTSESVPLAPVESLQTSQFEPVENVPTPFRMSDLHANMKAAKNTTPDHRLLAQSEAGPGSRRQLSSEERKRLMPSIPPTTDPASTCTQPHLDGCPECVVNGELPERRESVPNGCQAHYRCADCGHAWATSWWCD